jgi:branched-chain amino acid transport system substrate-binding protein
MFKLNHIIIIKILLLFPHLLLAESIKIGVAGPFSGPYVGVGDQQWQGAAQAVEDINENGGINGKKLELINADAACNPKQAVVAANRLVKDKVIAVVGHNCSSSTMAASKVYADANILMITPASTNPDITEQGIQTLFRTCGRDDKQGIIAGNYIHHNLKAKNIIVIHDSSLYGKSLAEQTKLTLEKNGANIVIYESIFRGEKDFRELIQKIKQTKADLIYYAGLHTDAGSFLKKLREEGNPIIFFSGDGIASPDFVFSAGGPNMVKGVYMTFYDPLSIPAAQKVIKIFEEKRIKPNGYTLNAYAAVQAIAQAIRQTGSTDSKQLSEWLHHNKVETVIGELAWDIKGDLKHAPYSVYKWNDDGEYERVN